MTTYKLTITLNQDGLGWTTFETFENLKSQYEAITTLHMMLPLIGNKEAIEEFGKETEFNFAITKTRNYKF